MDPILATLRADVLTAMRSVLGPSWKREGGADPYGRLYYIESGAACVRHHGRRFEMRPHRLYLIPAHSDLLHGCPRRVVIRWCHFTATVLGGLDLFQYAACEFDIAPREPQHIARLFARLVRVHGSGAAGAGVETQGILLQLLARFVVTADRGGLERRRSRAARFGPVLEHVEAHVAEPVRVTALASLVGLEPTYFSRTFAEHFGVGPAAYVLRKKVERAQRMLLESDATLESIAQSLAFTDAFHLSKTFKRLVGMPPAEFRRRRARGVP